MSGQAKRVGIVLVVLAAALLLWRPWSSAQDEPGGDSAKAEKSTSASAGHKGAGTSKHYEPGATVPKCEVSGSVRSEAGPIAGAFVHLAPIRGDLVGAASPGVVPEPMLATTNEAGRFSVKGVPDGPYWMTAAHGEHLSSSKRLGSGCNATRLELTLETGGIVISGTVKDALGGPVAGAILSFNQMRTMVDGEHQSPSAQSDASGNYRIRVATGSYSVTARHPDYVQAFRMIEAVGDTTVDLVLTPGAAIEGIVVRRDTGDPIAGAEVFARTGKGMEDFQAAFMGGSRGAVTDAQGRFRLRNVSSGAVTIGARAKGWATSEPVSLSLSIAEQVSDVTVFVDAGFSVRGRVVDQSNKEEGIQGIRTAVFDMGTKVAVTSEIPSAADGRFEIHGIAPGKYMVSSFGKAAIPKFMASRVEITDQDVDDVVLELNIGNTIRGTVTPPGPAKVGLDIDSSKMGIANMMTVMGSLMAQGTVANDGSFSVGPVADGSYFVVVVGEDGRTGRTEVEVKGDVDGVLVDIGSSLKISGRVKDQHGEPVVGALIKISKPRKGMFGGGGGPLGPKGARPTDERGEFTAFVDSPGEYELEIEDQRGKLPLFGQEKKYQAKELEVGPEGLSGLELQVERPDATIEGRVVDSGGAPVADAWVEAEIQNEPGQWVYVKPGAPVITDGDGKFRIPGLRKGKYEVIASATSGNAKARTKDVKTGSSIKLVLNPLGTISGTVTSAGSPVPAFTVNLQTSESRWGSNQKKRIRDEGGGFQFSRLEPGTYLLHVKSDMGEATTRVEIGSGKEATTTLEIEGYATITGRLVDEGGKPLPGAKFSARPMLDGKMVNSGMEDSFDMISGGGPETDEDGRFTLEKVPAGDAVVWLMAERGMVFKKRFIASKEVTTKPGETVDVGDITAREMGKAMGEDEDEDGEGEKDE